MSNMTNEPPSTVEEARQRVIDAAPIWEDVDTALDALVAVVRREEQQAASAMDRELAALSSDKQTLMTAVTHWRERAEQAEAQYAVAEAERVDSALLIQRVMKIVGDADGSGIETDEELLEALGRVEARVQGLDALAGEWLTWSWGPYTNPGLLLRAALAAAPAPRAHEENT